MVALWVVRVVDKCGWEMGDVMRVPGLNVATTDPLLTGTSYTLALVISVVHRKIDKQETSARDDADMHALSDLHIYSHSVRSRPATPLPRTGPPSTST